MLINASQDNCKRMFCRVIGILLLWISPVCYGQAITIRIVNGKNAHPLAKQHVSLSVLYDASELKPTKYDPIQHQDTDANGLAQFVLPETAPVHLSVLVRMTSDRWHCACDALVVTRQLIQEGIVVSGQLNSPPKTVSASPGEIVFVARPLTFFEVLLHSLLKG
jgi:hypothetical protein